MSRACVRCREPAELFVFRAEHPTHCKDCLEHLAESALLAWLQLFSEAHVHPEVLGGFAFAVALAMLERTSIDEADFLTRARQAWRDSAPLAQLVRHVLERKSHGNEREARSV